MTVDFGYVTHKGQLQVFTGELNVDSVRENPQRSFPHTSASQPGDLHRGNAANSHGRKLLAATATAIAQAGGLPTGKLVLSHLLCIILLSFPVTYAIGVADIDDAVHSTTH